MKKRNETRHRPDDFNKSLEQRLEILEKVGKLTSTILEKSTGFLIHRTSVRLRIDMLRKFKEKGYDVTPEQGLVLNTVWEHEGIYQRELADRTMKDKPTITRILDVLENKKLIYRQADSSDRRIFKIFLTNEGKKKIESFSSIISEVDARAFGGLTKAEIISLKKNLLKIRNNLEL